MTAVATQFGQWTNRAQNSGSFGGGAGQLASMRYGNYDGRLPVPWAFGDFFKRSRLWSAFPGYFFDWSACPEPGAHALLTERGCGLRLEHDTGYLQHEFSAGGAKLLQLLGVGT